MFSEMIAGLQQARMPESNDLAKRFDFALTKKLGVLKLPPAFWMNDPKINPRTDHLFWAALLLLDRNRIEMAVSVLEAELAESSKKDNPENCGSPERRVRALILQLLDHFSDSAQRSTFERNLRDIIPEWMNSLSGDN